MTTKYYALSTYLRQRFGERVQKIPLDGGMNCPNRDGTLSRHGCIFCNPSGSGTGQAAEGRTLAEQWDGWRDRFRRRYKARRFLAYLQSFSNSYGPVHRFAGLLDQLRALPDVSGICIGTRPDCLEPAKLDLLGDLDLPEVWLDIGLQSSNDETLARINRGHDAATFAATVRAAAARGLKICAHLIAGLPGETETDFLETVRFVNELPVHGVKFHNLYVCHNTPLAEWFEAGRYVPPSRDDYCRWLAQGLADLRQDIVIHRLNSDPAPGELIAPNWAGAKQTVRQAIHETLEASAVWQGCRWAPAPAPWFTPDAPLPPSLDLPGQEVTHV